MTFLNNNEFAGKEEEAKKAAENAAKAETEKLKYVELVALGKPFVPYHSKLGPGDLTSLQGTTNPLGLNT